MSYTISDLQRDFPDNDSVLEWLVNYLYPDGITCDKCQKITTHYKDSGRRSYSCGVCGHHFHPTAGTVFYKTKVPLTYWMYTIHRMTTTRNGVSAAALQRETGMTYNTCWKLLHKLRTAMVDKTGPLEGSVEADETYLHANVYKRSSARFRYGPTGARTGQVIFGIVQRGGPVKIRHVMTASRPVLLPIIEKEVKQFSHVYTDEATIYRLLGRRKYRHATTNHGRNEHVYKHNPDNHTQNIENVWSHFKRTIKGTYKCVSPKYLQNYCNEVAFRYSYRKNPLMFWVLASRVVEAPVLEI